MDIKQFIRIRLDSDTQEDVRRAYRLASILSLPPPRPKIHGVRFCLTFRDNFLELTDLEAVDKHTKPLCVDFLSGPVNYRFYRDLSIKQPLAKAVGIKKGVRPVILDVTAGLGGDGFILAALGSSVTMIERSPIIWALLEDGLRRALTHALIGPVISQRISLIHQDSKMFLRQSNQHFDTIYMDPMYPHRKKTALNKLKMRLLRDLVGDDQDSDTLLKTALKQARKRVVIKRPAAAPMVNEMAPSYSLKAPHSRYDIYLTNHL